MTAITKTKATGRRAKPQPSGTARTTAKPGRKSEVATAQTAPKRYTVSDGALLLTLEVEGDWFVVTSPLDPELVTQARTLGEAFRMAYDVKSLLEEYRAELAAKSRVPGEAKAVRRRSGKAARRHAGV